MGTSAFDRLWDDTPVPAPKPLRVPAGLNLTRAPKSAASDDTAAFDALWGTEKPAVPPTSADATRALARNRENVSGDYEVLGRGLAANALNAAQGIPGMEALEAAAGALGSEFTNHPLSYSESRDALRSHTKAIPTALSLPEKIAASLPLVAALPVKTIAQAAKSGAALGGADQLLNSDPNSGIADRLKRGAEGAAVGGAVGAGAGVAGKVAQKGGDLLDKYRLLRDAEPVDVQSFARSDAMHASDAQNYGHAAAEARRAGGTSPALQDALNHRRVQPFAEMFRDSEGGENADDATVAREADKLMTRQWKGLQKKMARDGYDAKVALEIKNLKAGQEVLRKAAATVSTEPPLTLDVAPEVFETAPKVTPGHEPLAGPIREGPLAETTTAPSDPTLRQALRDFPESPLPPKAQGPKGPAFQLREKPEEVTPGVRIETPAMRVQTAPARDVPPVMPSYPAAVAEHARREGINAAANTATDAASRIMNNRTLMAKDLPIKSPEAFRRAVQKMDPEQAQAALDAFLGRVKESLGYKAPTRVDSFFGTAAQNSIGPAVKLNRVSPFIDLLRKQAGHSVRPTFDPQGILELLGLANAPIANP